MTNEIITTLHPDQDPNTNLYPNIKKENIPNKSVDRNKLDDSINSLLNNIGELHPSGVDTSTNILAFTTDKGIYIGNDTGHWYYWDGTHYVDGGVYQALVDGDIYMQSKNFVNTNSSALSDLDNIVTTTMYYISAIEDCNISNKPTNLTGNWAFFSFLTEYNTSTNVIVQLLISTSNKIIYSRQKIGSYTWSAWEKASDESETIITTWFNSQNYTNISDLNSIKSNVQYYIEGSALTNISNAPQTTENGIFIAYKNYYNSNTYSTTQIFVTESGAIYSRNYRSYDDAWSNWSVPNQRTKITITTNGGFREFEQGMLNAYSRGNCDVYIEAGEYDLSSVAETLYSHNRDGIPIGKNNHYYFSSNSKIKCYYSGSDTYLQDLWSIFYAYDSDYIIENLTVDAKNIRYIIHDDCGGPYTNQYIHKYINCNLTIDNTNHNKPNTYFHCLGGGLGTNAEIVIENCYFNSVHVDPNNQSDVQYHGNWDTTLTDGKSNLYITNSYFEHAFGVSSPNTETQKKYVLYTNNNSLTDIIYNGTSSTYWDIKKWNNEIRS